MAESLLPKVTLLVVGINFIAKVIHVSVIGGEAHLVHVTTLTAACPVEVACVCGLRKANNREHPICGMADAGLVHGTGLCGRKLASSTCISFRVERSILP